jgi:hypothetical protein
MKEIKEQGYIVAGFKTIEPISYLEFKKEPEETNIPNQFIARNLKGVDVLKDSFSIRMSDIKNVDFDKKYYSRFCRLNKITNRYYHYLLVHTNDAVPKILESSREEFDRIIIFRSKNIIEHYNELIKIFMLNSLLQKRIVKSGKLSNLFSRFGYINKKKLVQLLQGKGEAVNPYTFQSIKPILDKDFQNKIDIIRYQHSETVAF